MAATLFALSSRDAPAPAMASWIICCVPGCRRDGLRGEGVNVRAGKGRFWCEQHVPARLLRVRP